MPKGKSSKLDIPEPARRHIAKIRRPHMAQEYREIGREEEADQLCRTLLPTAARCARGEVRPHIKARLEAIRAVA